jgi:hypothetical protein
MEVKALFFYLIVAIAIAALIIAIVALVNANKANSSLVNYTSLPDGTVILKSGNVTTGSFSTIYEIPIPTNSWNFDGFNMGVLGNVSVPIVNPGTATQMTFVTYASINGGEQIVIGASETINGPLPTIIGYNVNVNGVVGKVNKGDTVVLYITAQSTGGDVVISAPPENSAAIVYGPLNMA